MFIFSSSSETDDEEEDVDGEEHDSWTILAAVVVVSDVASLDDPDGVLGGSKDLCGPVGVTMSVGGSFLSRQF